MLTKFQTPSKDLNMMQTSWASLIDPLLANPLSATLILPNVALVTGLNTINHLLGRKLQGWWIVGQDAPATFYDSQATNTTPQLTLALNSSAPVIVQLVVF